MHIQKINHFCIVCAIVFLCICFIISIIYIALPTPNIIKMELSPNGKYIAYIFESNMGATSEYTYRLSIMKNNQKLGKSIGNAYISTNQFDITWINNDTLQVYNMPTINIFRQQEYVNGVRIKYKYIKG